MKYSLYLLLAGLAVILTSFGATHAAAQGIPKDGVARYVHTKLVPETQAVKPGETLTVAVIQTMEPDWHTYWRNPGDSGEALKIDWKLPEGFKAGDIQWPLPHRINTGPLTNFGFSEHATYLVDLSVPEVIATSQIDIKAELSWLVCKEICVPEAVTLDFSLPVIAADADNKPTDPALFEVVRKALPPLVSWPGMVEEQDGMLVLTFTPEESNDAPILKGAGNIEFYPYEWGVILNAENQQNSFDGKTLSLKVARDTRPLSKLGQIEGVVTFVDIPGQRRGVVVQVPVSAPTTVVENIAASSTGVSSSVVSKISLWQALGLAVLGGLILNLMPCVFPILSMKALSLVKMSAREQSHAVTHGLAYTFGVLVCFIGIAATLISLQHAGNQIGWGFQLQNPIVVLLLAYLLFIIGLNLSGMFEIGNSAISNLGSKLTQKQGYAGSFFTGMLATIVSTPCTAPFMGAAMGYALTQSSLTALLIFVALGIGLALPYLLLTAVPALRRALPKPGHWMETFRQFLAFPMYASTAWLLWVYGQQVDGAYGGLLGGLGLVFIAMGIWMWRNAPKRDPFKALVKILGAACLVAAVAIAAFSMMRSPVDPSHTDSADHAAIQHSGEWQPYTQTAFDAALAGNDPIFVNMTAAWCITCKVNERVALAVDETQKLFKDHKVLYLIGDWTNENPEITAYLKGYGRSGVPLYVYYGARDLTTNTRPDPVILPQLLTPGLITDVVTFN